MSVGEPLVFEVPNVGGGLNQGLPITGIGDHEAADLTNMYTFGTKAKRRRGSVKITSAAYSEALTSLFAYKLSTGTWLLLAGALTNVTKLSGGVLSVIPKSGGGSYTSDANPWHFRQYRDEVLAARKNTGTLKRLNESLIMDAGIPSPVFAPTLAAGAAGVLPAGTYKYVVTYVNRTTGAEGNPSPVGTVTIGANLQVNLSAIPVSSNAQVNGRRIYRSVKDNVGAYFRVAEIQDNATVAYSDNIAQDDLGGEVSFDHALPPSTVSLLEVWRERAWVSDGTDLFFSALGDTQHFGEFDIIQVYPDDGHEIRGLLAFGGRLMVGKTNAMHFVVRAGDTYDLQTLSDKHGLAAARSLVTAEGLIFWYSGDNVYRSEGVNVQSITTVKLREALDAIPEAMKEKVVGFTYPPESQYWFLCSRGSLTQNEVAYVYNYKTDSWGGPFEYALGSINFLGDFFDEDGSVIIYAAGADAFVWQLNSGTKDGTTAITAKFRSKAFGLDKPGLMKGVRRVGLLCDKLPETVTVRIYNDGLLVAAATRAGVTLYVDDAWKRITVSSLGALGAAVQVEIEYSGQSDFAIEGLLLETMAFVRRAVAI